MLDVIEDMLSNGKAGLMEVDLEQQMKLAQEGIRWLVCVIPAILLGLAMFIISMPHGPSQKNEH